jgi:hypothetical protein
VAPSVHEVNSWLRTRLSQAKKAESSNDQANSVARNTKKKNKSLQEKRQEDAAVLKRDQAIAVAAKAKRQLFLAKYRGILLENYSVIRIVKSVEYSNARTIWGLVAVRAKQDEYDDRNYFEEWRTSLNQAV